MRQRAINWASCRAFFLFISGGFLFSCFLFTGDLNLNVVAMALSGYTDEKSSLWREMCSSLRLQLKNPYLCVMFAFLTSEPGAYDGVLVLCFLLSRNFMALFQTQGTLEKSVLLPLFICT